MATIDRSDERDEPSIDALDAHGRVLLYETLLNDRRPIAVVGSGLSVVYGGVSWEESVKRAIAFTLERIEMVLADDAVKARSDYSAHRVYLERALNALSAFKAKGAIGESSEKYVALDLCSQALNRTDEIKNRPECVLTDDRKETGASSFRTFMAKVYKDDTFFIQHLLIERFDITGREDRKKILGLTPEETQRLACRVYSTSFLQKLVQALPKPEQAGRDQALTAILNDLRSGAGDLGIGFDTVLPIDRRSLLCLFVGDVPQTERRDALFEAVADACEAGLKVTAAPARPMLDPIGRLQEALRVKRYVTLNFDYTLEQRVILDDLHVTGERPYRLEKAITDGELVADGDTGGLTRRFADGLVASTDIYHPDAVGRVFEFALDSADFRAQILHLHGRADKPATMLLTDTDSNRQYRRDRSTRTSLEQALDVILTGNPIVFVGIGLSEAEITRALRDLVSRGYPTAFTPVFAIMAADQTGTTPWRRQMALFQQYGIHVIHAGLPDERWAGLAQYKNILTSLIDHLKEGSDLTDADFATLSRLTGAGAPDDPRLRGDLAAFSHIAGQVARAAGRTKQSKITITKECGRCWADYLDKLRSKLFTYSMLLALDDIASGWTDHVRQRQLPRKQDDKGALRFPRPQEDETDEQRKLFEYQVREEVSFRKSDKINIWRHEPEGLGKIPPHIRPIAEQIQASQAPVVTSFSPLGAGKGRLLIALQQYYHNQKRPSLIINCNFGIEFDSALSQTLGFLWHFLEHPQRRSPPPMHDRIRTIRKLAEFSPSSKPGHRIERKDPVLVLSGIERLIDRRGQPVAPELDLLLTALLSEKLNRGSPFQIVIIGADGCAKYIDAKLENAKLKSVASIGKGLPPVEEAKSEGTDAQAASIANPPPLANAVDNIAWQDSAFDPRKRGFLGHLLRVSRKKLASGKIPNGEAIASELRYAAGRSAEATVPNSARSRAIEAVMRVVLDHWHALAFNGSTNPTDRLRAQLDQHVLGTLAFIGMPIEATALDHQNTPSGLIEQIAIRDGAISDKKRLTKKLIEDERKATIARLRTFGFLVLIKPHPGAIGAGPAPADRIVLHRSAMAEMRERIGVRSGDELLSNGFSVTLAISMPTDLIVPEEGIQRELKTAVGRLRGSWRDPLLRNNDDQQLVGGRIKDLREVIVLQSSSKSGAEINKFDAELLKAEAWLRALDRALRMATTDMQVNIRAAAGVIRGFFSAASLVAQMPSRTERGDRELGEFEEHKRRLGHVMNRFREAQRALPRAYRLMSNIADRYPSAAATAQYRAVEALIAGIAERKKNSGAKELPALYGAELVWLLNERSVIALLQGDLYEAQRGFREASAANKVFRNREHGQVWRRIEINRSLLRIERGRIGEARTQLEAIEQELNGPEIQSPYERDLTRPLVESYLGLCDHLGGSYTKALRRFKTSIKGLIDTDQQRALAVTYIRRAVLHYGLGEKEKGNKDIELGSAIAEAGRQMDILWRARLTSIRGRDQPTDSERIMTIFRESRRYAQVMQLPRIEIHALRSEAEFYLNDIDDYEYAGVLASEAMTIATRYGMVLQRIALRVLMGKILLRRNDMSGRHLLQRAIAHADRVGYQLQVDRAQQAFLEASLRQPD